MKKKSVSLKKKAPLQKKLPVRKAVRKKTLPKASPAIALKKILVPVDFSDHSRKALNYAIPFAEQFHATLHVLYVVEPTIYPADLSFGQVGLPNLEAELRSKSEQELVQLVAEMVGDRVLATAVIRTGLPFVEIIAFAREEDVDLIIVATHGHTGVEHILFGSTAEKIVRKAPCPVLVVRADERDFVNERV
jgi:nucleotide-binding universal stress UspA family protein